MKIDLTKCGKQALQKMKLYIQFDAIPGIWEYSDENAKHNITNEIVKKNICEHLAPMANTKDKGQISKFIANDHHFSNSITRGSVLDLPWGCGPTGSEQHHSKPHHGHSQEQDFGACYQGPTGEGGQQLCS
jgi:hypothetical protein